MRSDPREFCFCFGVYVLGDSPVPYSRFQPLSISLSVFLLRVRVHSQVATFPVLSTLRTVDSLTSYFSSDLINYLPFLRDTSREVEVSIWEMRLISHVLGGGFNVMKLIDSKVTGQVALALILHPRIKEVLGSSFGRQRVIQT